MQQRVAEDSKMIRSSTRIPKRLRQSLVRRPLQRNQQVAVGAKLFKAMILRDATKGLLLGIVASRVLTPVHQVPLMTALADVYRPSIG